MNTSQGLREGGAGGRGGRGERDGVCVCARALRGRARSPGVGFVQIACAIDEDTTDDKRHYRLLMHVARFVLPMPP